MTETDLTFSWSNLPPDISRSFASSMTMNATRARLNLDEALELLQAQAPIPTADLFRRPEVRWVVTRRWLAEDRAALDIVFGALLGGVIPSASSGRVVSDRRKLAAVKQAVDPVGGRMPSNVVRAVLADALITVGGGVMTAGESPKLNRLNVVPTRGTTVSLHPHQARVIAALRDTYRNLGNAMAGVVVMPTGSGKTLTAVRWLLDDAVRGGAKVLWITHRRELLDQTADAFLRSAPVLQDDHERISLRLIGAGYGPASTIADSGHNVVVATIGALAHDMQAVTAFLRKYRCVVVFDEAHHCVAPTWRRVLDLARSKTDDAVVGLTATPTRMSEGERRLLGRLFETTIAEVQPSELVAGNYLAEAHCQSVSTDVDVEAELANASDLSHLAQYGELSPRLAHLLAENVPRNQIIVDTYKRGPADGKEASYEQTIVFAVTIDHAHTLARDFAAAGITAGALTASWSTIYSLDGSVVREQDLERDTLLSRFRSGELPVLVNVGVLTEGVDLPKTKTVFLARPTGSEVLMSQMVGRALRGEKVGGTACAYLVSFRDHWDQFGVWADPTRLAASGQVDVIEPAIASSPPAGAQTMPEEEWRRLLESAASDVREHVHASIKSSWTRTLIGLYKFEIELPIDGDAADEDIDARAVQVWVHEHEQGGYDALSEAVKGRSAGVDANEWGRTYFAETPEPKPAKSLLEYLARYVAAEGQMPAFIALDRRERTDPRQIAAALQAADARRDEREAAIIAAYQGSPALVDAFYGGLQGLRQQVLEQLYQLEAGIPQGFDELVVPRVRLGDRLDHTYGEDAHDLELLLEQVRTDPDLFNEPMRSPLGGIDWTSQPLRSAWAQYQWDTTGEGPEKERILVNRLLDSHAVPETVLKFLIYHELLHHQDVLNGRPGHAHDQHFRARERRHPAITEANAFIDTFFDRMVPINPDGRPLRA